MDDLQYRRPAKDPGEKVADILRRLRRQLASIGDNEALALPIGSRARRLGNDDWLLKGQAHRAAEPEIIRQNDIRRLERIASSRFDVRDRGRRQAFTAGSRAS